MKDHTCTNKELEDKITALEIALAVTNTTHEKDMVRIDTALVLQAKEYERRLDLLNGEASRLRDIQATYLPREVYEVFKKDQQNEIYDLKSFKDATIGRQGIIGYIVPTIISAIISLGFLLINRFLK